MKNIQATFTPTADSDNSHPPDVDAVVTKDSVEFRLSGPGRIISISTKDLNILLGMADRQKVMGE